MAKYLVSIEVVVNALSADEAMDIVESDIREYQNNDFGPNDSSINHFEVVDAEEE